MATTWIQTLEGRKLEPLAITKDMVGSIEEIAHALAGKYRFTGQTQARYSVAEHCVRGADLLPYAYAGAFLLHELSEVYLPDLAAPLKPFVLVNKGGIPMNWDDLEREHTRIILESLGLSSIESLINSPEVRRMDLAMLAAEKRDLCGPEPEDWKLPYPPATIETITPWSSNAAEAAFIYKFNILFKAQK